VDSLSTARAKRRHLAAPARLALHIHIPRHAAPAAPERLFSAGAGKRGVFFAAHGALADAIFFYFYFRLPGF
jgi:hypothetical protein